MSIFSGDTIALPEINADVIREAANGSKSGVYSEDGTLMSETHLTHEQIMDIINDIVHSIYYTVKAKAYSGVYPIYSVDMKWEYSGSIFHIPMGYASYLSDPVFKKRFDDAIANEEDTTVDCSDPSSVTNDIFLKFYDWNKIKESYKYAEETIDYIKDVFTKLGFEFTYNASLDNKENIIIISIPFKTQDFESIVQRVFTKTIAASVVPVVPMTPPMFPVVPSAVPVSVPTGNLFYMDFPDKSITTPKKSIKRINRPIHTGPMILHNTKPKNKTLKSIRNFLHIRK